MFGVDRFLDGLLVVIISSMCFVVYVAHVDQRDATPVNKIMTFAILIIVPLHVSPCYVFGICGALFMLGVVL